MSQLEYAEAALRRAREYAQGLAVLGRLQLDEAVRMDHRAQLASSGTTTGYRPPTSGRPCSTSASGSSGRRLG